MLKRKFCLPFALMAALALVLAGCGGGQNTEPAGQGAGTDEPAAAGETVNIRLAHTGSESHQYHLGATIFKEQLESLSNNTMKVEIYPNATLGSEKDAIEGVMNGTVDMTVLAADSSLANVVPEMNVFGIPFLFEDKEHVYAVLDGEIGQSLLQKIDEKGMKGLGYWEIGFRNMTTANKPIEKPEDLAGLKMRVQPAPVWEEFMKALGANPTAVNFNELYSALEQGVVDGQENPVATILSMKFYEVQKQLALTQHTYSPAAVLMSQKLYNALTEEQKQWLAEAVKNTTEEQRNVLAEQEAQGLEELRNHGVNITEPDRAAFAEKTKDVANAVADKVPAALIEQIKAAAN